jgi:hypothetical protein
VNEGPPLPLLVTVSRYLGVFLAVVGAGVSSSEAVSHIVGSVLTDIRRAARQVAVAALQARDAIRRRLYQVRGWVVRVQDWVRRRLGLPVPVRGGGGATFGVAASGAGHAVRPDWGALSTQERTEVLRFRLDHVEGRVEQLVAAGEQAMVAEARGLPLIAGSVVLTGIPDAHLAEIADMPFLLGWIAMSIVVSLTLYASGRARTRPVTAP